MELEEKELETHEVLIKPDRIQVIRISYIGIRGILTSDDEKLIRLAFKYFMRHELPYRGLPAHTTRLDVEDLCRKAKAHLVNLYHEIHPWVNDLTVKAF